MMRLLLAIMVLLITGTGSMAQDRYFLCVQTENRQPFYIRMANQTYGSTNAGNLVVPSLGDSTYQLAIGFPNKQYPEQQFLVTFNRKDMGFTLKQSSSQWVLVDWTSGETRLPRTDLASGEKTWYGEKKKDDAFTTLMAAVVNDSAVLYAVSARNIPEKQEVFANADPAPAETVVKTGLDPNLNAGNAGVKNTPVTEGAVTAQATAAQDSVQAMVRETAIPKSDSSLVVVVDSAAKKLDNSSPVVAAKTAELAAGKDSSLVQHATEKDSSALTAGVPAAKEGTAAANTPILVYTAPAPPIAKLMEIDGATTRTLVFTDSSAGKVDTIAVMIDLDTAKAEIAKSSATAETVKNNITSSPATDADNVRKEPAAAASKTATETDAEKKKMVLINSDCSNFATDHDIDKLRVKLMDEPTIDTKLNAVRKLLKSKCMYTRQIRALSELFMNDEGKLKFFELSYPLTADTSEFRQLIGLLSEDAYIARFKTLVRIKD